MPFRVAGDASLCAVETRSVVAAVARMRPHPLSCMCSCIFRLTHCRPVAPLWRADPPPPFPVLVRTPPFDPPVYGGCPGTGADMGRHRTEALPGWPEPASDLDPPASSAVQGRPGAPRSPCRGVALPGCASRRRFPPDRPGEGCSGRRRARRCRGGRRGRARRRSRLRRPGPSPPRRANAPYGYTSLIFTLHRGVLPEPAHMSLSIQTPLFVLII